MSEAAQRKEKQEWLSGIYFIDPDDVEFNEAIKRKRAESADGSSNLTLADQNMYLQGSAWKELNTEDPEDHIAGKGIDA